MCLCSLFTLFLSSSISIQHMGHTIVVPVLHLSGLKGILRRPGPCSGRQLHYSLPCVPGTPKVRNPHIQPISPHSAPRAPTRHHTNIVYTLLIGVCYYTVTIQELSRAFFTPSKVSQTAREYCGYESHADTMSLPGTQWIWSIDT